METHGLHCSFSCSFSPNFVYFAFYQHFQRNNKRTWILCASFLQRERKTLVGYWKFFMEWNEFFGVSVLNCQLWRTNVNSVFGHLGKIYQYRKKRPPKTCWWCSNWNDFANEKAAIKVQKSSWPYSLILKLCGSTNSKNFYWCRRWANKRMSLVSSSH